MSVGADPDPTTRRGDAPRGRGIAVAALMAMPLLAIALPFAGFSLFSDFRPYDDEGYLMMTVAHLMGGRAPYDEVPTPYGPSYYAMMLLLHDGAGIGLTSDNLRWITLAFWLADAGLGALLAWRLTRRPFAGAACFLALLVYGRPLVNEPGHPQLLGAMLVVLLPLAATWFDAGRPARLAAALGALAACVALVKLNLGVFAALGVMLAMAAATGGRLARAALAALTAAAALLPFVLMRQQLGDPRWLSFAIVTAVGVLAMAAVAWRLARPIDARPLPIAAAMLAGGVAAAVPPILVVLARGTSPLGLVDGLVLVPLRLGSSMGEITRRGPVYPIGAAWAAIAAGAVAVFLLVGKRGRVGPAAGPAWMLLKGAFGVCALLPILNPSSHSSVIASGIQFNFVTPFLWLLLVAPAGRPPDRAGAVARLVLGFVAVLTTLLAFPISGSQRPFGTWLHLPIAVVCLADAVSWAEGRVGGRPAGRRAARLVLPAATIAMGAFVAWESSRLGARYRDDLRPVPALQGRGAGLIRVPEREAAIVQWLVANLSRHADTFLCPRGLNSLYSWAGLPSPSPIVLGSSLDFFSDPQKRQVVRSLREYPRACVVFSPDPLRRPGDPPPPPPDFDDPLLGALHAEYVPCGVVDGFEFRVREGRPSPALVDCVRRDDPAESVGEGDARETTATLDLTPIRGAEVDRFQVVAIDSGAVVADTHPEGEAPLLRVVDLGSPGPRSADRHGGGGPGTTADRRLRLAFPGPLPDGEGMLVLRLIDRGGAVVRSLPVLDRPPVAADEGAGRDPSGGDQPGL